MYGEQYILAACLYFISIVWLAAKLLVWEETKTHDKRLGISIVTILLATLVFGLSIVWVWSRSAWSHPQFETKMHENIMAGYTVTGPLPNNWPDSLRSAKKIEQIAFMVELDNTGKIPSIAQNFQIRVTPPGRAAFSIYPMVEPNVEVWTPHHEKLIHIEKSWLYNKALVPIQPGSAVCGWIVFMVADVSARELDEPNVDWMFLFEDIDRREHKAHLWPADEKSTQRISNDEQTYDSQNPCIEEHVILPPPK